MESGQFRGTLLVGALVSIGGLAALPAVVSIQAGSSRGTGFFVRPDFVLTNQQVIEGQALVDLIGVNSLTVASLARQRLGFAVAIDHASDLLAVAARRRRRHRSRRWISLWAGRPKPSWRAPAPVPARLAGV